MLAASTGLGLISSVRILYEVESPASSSGFALKTLMSPGISGLGSRQSIRSHNEPCDSRSRDFQGSPWYMLRCAGIVTTSVTWLSQVGSSSSASIPTGRATAAHITWQRAAGLEQLRQSKPKMLPPLWVELLPGCAAAELGMAVRSPELSFYLIGDDR